MIAPAPANELSKLLENEKIKDTTSSHLIIIIIRYTIPVETLEGLGEGHDEGDGEGIGVSKHLARKGLAHVLCKVQFILET